MYKDVFEQWYGKVTEVERAELDSFRNDEKEIKERFGAELKFGTAGMRGEVGLGTNRMNGYTVGRATEGVAKYVVSLGEEAKKRGVVISYDTRRFSREFALNAAEVLSAYGVKVYLFEDVRPVPICSFAVRRFGAVAGIMITASHNPKEYNGYKVYGDDGAQMAPEATAVVVGYINEIADYFAVKRAHIDPATFVKGKSGYNLDAHVEVVGSAVDEDYFAEVEKLLLSRDVIKRRGKDLKLVYTPVHGAGYMPVTTMFRRLGVNVAVVEEQVAPDTEFSTVRVPNPENADTLAMGVALGNKIGADVVLGTDPDSDRLGVAVRNREGEFVLLTGNQIGVMLLDYIITRRKETGTMPHSPALVKTIVTTTMADRIAVANGVTVFNVLTGFKFIGEKIKEWEAGGEYSYIFGFEESYGSLAGTYARDKDAVMASVLFAEMTMYLEEKGIGVYGRLEQLFAEYGRYVESNSSVTYKGLDGMAKMASVTAKLRATEVKELGGEPVEAVSDYLTGIKTYADGRTEKIDLPKSDVIYYSFADGQFACVRPSGTEPKLKTYVLVYSDTADSATAKAQRVEASLKDMAQ